MDDSAGLAHEWVAAPGSNLGFPGDEIGAQFFQRSGPLVRVGAPSSSSELIEELGRSIYLGTSTLVDCVG